MEAKQEENTAQRKYSQTEGVDKNIDEYNKSASAYDEWCATNVLMQKCWRWWLKNSDSAVLARLQ